MPPALPAGAVVQNLSLPAVFWMFGCRDVLVRAEDAGAEAVAGNQTPSEMGCPAQPGGCWLWILHGVRSGSCGGLWAARRAAPLGSEQSQHSCETRAIKPQTQGGFLFLGVNAPCVYQWCRSSGGTGCPGHISCFSASPPFIPGLLIAVPQFPHGKSPAGDEGQEDAAQQEHH